MPRDENKNDDTTPVQLSASTLINSKTAYLPKLTLDTFKAWYSQTSTYLESSGSDATMRVTAAEFTGLGDKHRAAMRYVFLQTITQPLLDRYKQSRIMYNDTLTPTEKAAWNQSTLNCGDFLTWIVPIAEKHRNDKQTTIEQKFQRAIQKMARNPAPQFMDAFIRDITALNVQYDDATSGHGFNKTHFVSQLEYALANRWDSTLDKYTAKDKNNTDLEALFLALSTKAHKMLDSPPDRGPNAAFGVDFAPPPTHRRQNELCRDFGRGHCPRGANCPYTHTPSRSNNATSSTRGRSTHNNRRGRGSRRGRGANSQSRGRGQGRRDFAASNRNVHFAFHLDVHPNSSSSTTTDVPIDVPNSSSDYLYAQQQMQSHTPVHSLAITKISTPATARAKPLISSAEADADPLQWSFPGDFGQTFELKSPNDCVGQNKSQNLTADFQHVSFQELSKVERRFNGTTVDVIGHHCIEPEDNEFPDTIIGRCCYAIHAQREHMFEEMCSGLPHQCANRPECGLRHCEQWQIPSDPIRYFDIDAFLERCSGVPSIDVATASSPELPVADMVPHDNVSVEPEPHIQSPPHEPVVFTQCCLCALRQTGVVHDATVALWVCGHVCICRRCVRSSLPDECPICSEEEMLIFKPHCVNPDDVNEFDNDDYSDDDDTSPVPADEDYGLGLMRIFDSYGNITPHHAWPTILSTPHMLFGNVSGLDEFYVDSGASTCVVGCRGLLHDFQPHPSTINGIGGQTNSTGYGNLILSVHDSGGAEISLGFKNTLCIPGAPNLLSVSCLTRGGALMRAGFPDATITIGDHHFHATRRQDLYILSAKILRPPSPTASMLPECSQMFPAQRNFADVRSLQHLHSMLGHANLQKLQRLLRAGELQGLPQSVASELKSTRDLLCENCAHGKLTRRKHTPSVSHFDDRRFHSDTYGPCPISFAEKCRYAVIFVYQAYDFWFLFGLHSRTCEETLAAFNYAVLVAQHYGNDVCALMSDNGTEFVSGKFERYLKDQGILRQLSAPGRQDSNGRAERPWRTLNEACVTHLSESGLTSDFWLYSYQYTTFWRNRDRVPSPYEMFFGTTPKLPQRHPFGCLVLYLNKDPSRKKFDSRSLRGVYLGPSSAGKVSHKILALSSKRVITRSEKDCKFFPLTFPMQSSRSDRSAVPRADTDIVDPLVFEGVNSDSNTQAITTVSIDMDEIVSSAQRINSDDEERKYAADEIEAAADEIEADNSSSNIPYVRGMTPSLQPTFRSAEAERRGLRSVVQPTDLYQPVDFRLKQKAKRANANFMDFTTFADIDADNVYFNTGNSVYFHAQRIFTACTIDGDEPTFKQAMQGPERPFWIEACKEEIASLEKIGVFKIVPTPADTTEIGGRWVFKKKRGRNGEVLRYKARAVAQGFKQIHGQHYFETFAPTLKMASLRLFLAFAVHRSWHLAQLDVKTAFLIPRLPESETIYMKPLPGMSIPAGHSLKILHCLYGLRQSARAWNTEFNTTLKSLNFEPTDADPCVYTMKNESGDIVATLCLHVDDAILGAEQPLLDAVVQDLMSKYEMTNQGVPDWLLGIGVDYDQHKGVLRLSQSTYITAMLEQFNMVNCNPVKSPASANRLTSSSKPMSQADQDAMRNVPYRNLVGALMYAMVATRPDIAFATIQVAKFNENPTLQHWTAAKRILRYLKGTIDYGLTFTRSNNFDVQGYSDADWAGDTDTRRSTTGYVFTAMGTPISWRSKLQRVVALSSCESELIAIVDAGKEAVWIRKALRGYNLMLDTPLNIHEDNQGTIAIATNSRGMSNRTKHVATRYFAVREWIDNGEINVIYISTVDQLADIFTKGLPVATFIKLIGGLGLDRCASS